MRCSGTELYENENGNVHLCGKSRDYEVRDYAISVKLHASTLLRERALKNEFNVHSIVTPIKDVIRVWLIPVISKIGPQSIPFNMNSNVVLTVDATEHHETDAEVETFLATREPVKKKKIKRSWGANDTGCGYGLVSRELGMLETAYEFQVG